MSRKQYWFLAALVVLSGFVGGATVTWLAGSQNAFAQQPKLQKEIVQAKEIHLVDANGTVRVVLSLDKNKDSKGLAVKSKVPWIGIYDEKGALVGSIPPMARPVYVK